MGDRTSTESEALMLDVEQAWADALTSAVLLSIDPFKLNGVVLRAGAGPVRDAWVSVFRELCPDRKPPFRLPLAISHDRLLGGLDLPATLRFGYPVHQSGLLADADGRMIIAPMAERMDSATAAVIASALDHREIKTERDGVSACHKTNFGLISLDESSSADERISSLIADRLAFHVDLTTVPLRVAQSTPSIVPSEVANAAALLADATCDTSDQGPIIDTLVSVACAFGIRSLRAPLLAFWAAKAAAALRGSCEIDDKDLELVARLVLAPRATRLPASPPDENEEPEPPQTSEDQSQSRTDDDNKSGPDKELNDVVLEAVAASLPKSLLSELTDAASATYRTVRSSGQAGAPRRSLKRGRPIGVGRGDIKRGARLAVVDTLRAAAPWQRMRETARMEVTTSASVPGRRRVEIRPDDFRFRRYAERSEALTIFIVDASGSTALHRLGEAKGAVELLLADCYVRRDWVALVSLRGRDAEIVLPPTRALARAKRDLAGLPGGGGTPLASGIDKSVHLALAGRNRGQQPSFVFLTDGAANVARDGRTGRQYGQDDALAAARSAVVLNIPSILIDTGPRPSPFAERLAEALHGRYFALPMADAKTLSTVVKRVAANA